MDPQVWQYSLGFKNNDNEMLDPAEVYKKISLIAKKKKFHNLYFLKMRVI